MAMTVQEAITDLRDQVKRARSAIGRVGQLLDDFNARIGDLERVVVAYSIKRQEQPGPKYEKH